MVKYNDILKLHSEGMNNSQISKEVGCARGTVIDAIKRAASYDINELIGLSDEEIHHLLHIPPKRNNDFYVPDMGRVVFEVGLPKHSIAKVWEEIRSEADYLGQKTYAKTTLQLYLKQLQGEFEPTSKKGGMVVSLHKNIIKRDDKEYNLIIGEDVRSGFVTAHMISDLNPRAWSDANKSVLQSLGGVPEIYEVNGKLPKALDSISKEFAKWYGMEFTVKKDTEKHLRLAEEIRDRILDNNDASFQFIIDMYSDEMNRKPMYYFSLFDKSDALVIEKKVFRPLPNRMYEVVETKYPSVQPNFHIKIDGVFYSVPFAYRHEHLYAKVSDSFVEVYLDDAIICTHTRVDASKQKYVTDMSHMPASDREIPFGETSGKSLRKWADKIGTSVRKVVECFLSSDGCEQHGYLVCLSLLHQAASVGNERLNHICEKQLANKKTRPSYSAILYEIKNSKQ